MNKVQLSTSGSLPAVLRRAALATLATAVVCVVAGGSASSAFAAFGIAGFDGSVLSNDGVADTQAGSHPHEAATSIEFTTKTKEGSGVYPDGGVKDLVVELPPGLVGNPNVVAQCTDVQLAKGLEGECSGAAQVGVITIGFSQGGFPLRQDLALYNLVPPAGAPAQFGFNLFGSLVHLTPRVRTGGDYGLNIVSNDISQALPVYANTATLWGVPSDSSHDALRGCEGPIFAGCSSGLNHRPFLRLPTSCAGPQPTTMRAAPWENPFEVHVASFLSHDEHGIPVGVDGCDRLEFNPSISVQPSETSASSPTGLSVELRLPQNESVTSLAGSDLRQAVVSLPEGMTVNPAAANGLGSCAPAQVDLDGPGAAKCPKDSKIGTVLVDTPLLDQPLDGAVYLAKQDDNPFRSLLALYISIDDSQTGIAIKLAGRIEVDPSTGRLTASFDDNPQLPFSSFRLDFFGGPRAALVTPPSCGSYATVGRFGPWSAVDPDNPTARETATATDSFAITSGSGGASCPSPGQFDPSFGAGTVTPIAGSYSPLAVNASRPDGSEVFRGLNFELPEGLLGRLAGIPYCSDAALAAAAAKTGQAERSASSCPAASRIGAVDVTAGAGGSPIPVGGGAYLAGPYKGAPFSVAAVVPAVAGPFDLGSVVVRARAEVDPLTAAVGVISDQLPTILQGIPLGVRTLSISVDRPEFMLNPTDCDPMQVTGTLLGTTASRFLSSRFQVGACAALSFKPKLALKLSGKTKRSAHPKLRATLTMPNGGANIQRAQVTLPKTEILAQEHIRTVCTRVQYAAKACPKASVYGYARAWSPLLDQPLQGPVYLRSSNNPLPDLVASLDGQIHIDLAGRIDSVNARIRNTFDLVPDAPVSKFVLTMQGGKKGLLVNNTELCRAKPRADVKFDGQNGKTADSRPLVKVDCGKKGKRAKK